LSADWILKESKPIFSFLLLFSNSSYQAAGANKHIIVFHKVRKPIIISLLGYIISSF
jgi:hypothetical protein